MHALPRDDVYQALELAGDFWAMHQGARILVTGATGTIGRWLLETIHAANEAMNCRIEVVALVRDEQRAFRRLGLARRSDLSLIQGDVRTFDGSIGGFDLCVHAAAQIGNGPDALDVFDTTVSGTRRMLDLAHRAGAGRFLLTSSGAVYGEQPRSVLKLAETYVGAPALSVKAAYANAKRAAEWITLASTSDSKSGLTACIARIFAVAGPGLPLDGHFAFGNFIGDVVERRAIAVNGDGRTLRSYLYLSDVASWLLRILRDGRGGEAYNVGSEREVSVGALARMVAQAGQGKAVEVHQSPSETGPPERYVPDTSKARAELGVRETVPLEAAVTKTVNWALAR